MQPPAISTAHVERTSISPAGTVPDTLTDTAPRIPTQPVQRFSNRELSWLDFNARVLALAEDESRPLLERVKFLAIFATNLDEFSMVRVAGLQRRVRAGLPSRAIDGRTPQQQLDSVTERVTELMRRHARCLREQVLPALAAEGVRVTSWQELETGHRERLGTYFRECVFPILTPLAVDAARPFPYVSGLSLNIAVLMRDPTSGVGCFARVKVPNNIPRFLTVEDGRFLPVEELIAAHLGQLFPGLEILQYQLFRITRDADLDLDEDSDDDPLQALERELARRRFGSPVRLEVTADAPDHVLDLLMRELDITSRDIVRVPGLLDLSAMWQLYSDIDRPDMKDQRFSPIAHPRIAGATAAEDIFALLRDKDILAHHPYHSFSSTVQNFIEQAAADPSVLAIKMTLYRTSGDSPIVDALVAAAQAGKQVVVVVEIKARFDEEANIGWARMLEQAGCHVTYGIVGLKTHCKTALIVRSEDTGIRRYCHVGTGNYHPTTARLYEDFGLLTADPEVGTDIANLFNLLTGHSQYADYRRLLVAPHGIRDGIIERINREIIRTRIMGDGLIQLKVNSLNDEDITNALYRASQAGVRVDLIVRGVCTLRPGIPGISDNIRVRSILGRFLEHSRVFRFGAGPHDGTATEFWLGSADLMHRNLDRRIEALIRITDPTATEYLQTMFGLCLADDIAAFDLGGDGVWRKTAHRGDTLVRDAHKELIRRTL